MSKQQTKLRVRLYARLSKDDGDADKESNSITNQLLMLRYNAKEKGFEVIGEFVDDGYSGTTFNRPDLNRMIKEAMDDPEPSGIRTKIRAEEKKTQSTNQFLETIRKYETVTELNRSMLVELIDSIYVYQAEGVGRERKQKVEINYRFLAGSQCGIARRKWKNEPFAYFAPFI